MQQNAYWIFHLIHFYVPTLPHRRRYMMWMIWSTDWLQRDLGAADSHRRGHWPVCKRLHACVTANGRHFEVWTLAVTVRISYFCFYILFAFWLDSYLTLLADFDIYDCEHWSDFFLIFTRYSRNIRNIWGGISNVHFVALLAAYFITALNTLKQCQLILTSSYCCKLLE